MSLSLYDVSIPPLIATLERLSNILKKGEEFAHANGQDLLDGRLAPDMFALPRQVQIASDAAKGCAARLAGIDPPKFEDTEKTFPELQARITKTIDFLKSLKPDQVNGGETREIALKFPGRTLTYKTGRDFLLFNVLPNFYFHVTTAYGILRNKGVAVGKQDFLDGSKLTVTETA